MLDEAYLAILTSILFVPVSAYIVSGSVVVSGNILHWVEKKDAVVVITILL